VLVNSLQSQPATACGRPPTGRPFVAREDRLTGLPKIMSTRESESAG